MLTCAIDLMKLKATKKCESAGIAGLRGAAQSMMAAHFEAAVGGGGGAGATLDGKFLKCLVDNVALIDNPGWSVNLLVIFFI